ncbi:amino acid permease 6 [Spinacia oleracea]|uniref:Amino acid permease 6 n=1 Tax=Spinacia oleracea TaxID=3562 RepID=A0A9R0IEM9_SPIOL|nr:amino acid permease 6-like [Spinacia oleracea]
MVSKRDEESQKRHGVLSPVSYQFPYDSEEFDDDGKPRRTGTVWTASAHIITAIIGSGVLSLAWATAQLGWLGGISTLLIFSGIMLYTSNLLADCYRTPDPVTGKRNYTYMDEVQANLGRFSCIACGILQYANLTGFVVGYTITAPKSMVAVQKSNCFHKKGHMASCMFSNNPYMIGFGVCEIFLSQIPNFHELTWLSTIAAIMSFAYSTIGIGLALYRILSGNGGRTTLTGVEIGMGISAAEKTWRMLRAIGDIAFAYGFSQILVDIQDTLKSHPAENKVMKKANAISMLTTTVFYMMCGCLGYAAFGNDAPGNMLTGFGFYEPFWLIDLANIFIVIHIVGAYQVLAQPVYKKIESLATGKWPNSFFVKAEYPIRLGSKLVFSLNPLRLTGRTIYVVLVTILSMALPFFNDVIALLGALGFWPLAVYFPIQMHIAQNKIKPRSFKWFLLQLLNVLCFLVSLAAAAASIQGIGEALRTSKPFQFKE